MTGSGQGDGLNYIKYEGNPVLTGADVPEGFSVNDFRDPKIFRNTDGISFECSGQDCFQRPAGAVRKGTRAEMERFQLLCYSGRWWKE